MLAKAGNPKPLETPWYEAEFGCLQMFAFFRVYLVSGFILETFAFSYLISFSLHHK